MTLRRIAARLIDVTIGILCWVIGVMLYSRLEASSVDGTGIVLVSLASAYIAYWMYEILATAAFGKTIGKSVLGLLVTRSDGGRVGLGRSVARATCVCTFALYLPVGLFLFVWSWSSHRRHLHDVIANTAVSLTSTASSPASAPDLR